MTKDLEDVFDTFVSDIEQITHAPGNGENLRLSHTLNRYSFDTKFYNLYSIFTVCGLHFQPVKLLHIYTHTKRMFSVVYWNPPVCPCVHVSVFVQNTGFCQRAGAGIKAHLESSSLNSAFCFRYSKKVRSNMIEMFIPLSDDKI